MVDRGLIHHCRYVTTTHVIDNGVYTNDLETYINIVEEYLPDASIFIDGICRKNSNLTISDLREHVSEMLASEPYPIADFDISVIINDR